MNAADAKPTPDRTRPEVHHGTFAEGECDPEKYPDEEHVGTFADRVGRT